MTDEEEQKAKRLADISVGADLSTLSVSDLDEWIEVFQTEIARLKEEKSRKKDSFDIAEQFFKSS